jgi:trimethylamine:corrinoid methyltransferase-like protein
LGLAVLQSVMAVTELSLLNAAEAHIDTATAHLLLTIKGVSHSLRSQEAVVADLRAAKVAIGAVRERIAHPPA